MVFLSRRMYRGCLIALVTLGFWCVPHQDVADASITATSTVVVTSYGCQPYRDIPPSMELADADGIETYHSSNIVPRRIATGAYEFVISTRRSHFWMRVIVGKCSTRVPVSVMPGHRRSIVLFPSDHRIPAIGARHWIAGCLAPGIGSVLLTRNYSGAAAGTIDDGCYYLR